MPFPKELIKQALSEELLEPTNAEMLNIIEEGFLELESFLSDDEFELIKEFESAVNEVQQAKDENNQQVIDRVIILMQRRGIEAEEIYHKVRQQQEARSNQLQYIKQIRTQNRTMLLH